MDKVLVEVIDVDVEDFNFYKCTNCHWRFVGDAQRFMHNGYTYESTDLVNYCPMCGKKIEDIKGE